MKKRFLLLTALSMALSVHLTGCTSDDAQPEDGAAKSADQASGDAAVATGDQPKSDGLDLDPKAPGDGSPDLALEDADPEHEFPDSVAQAPPSTDGAPAANTDQASAATPETPPATPAPETPAFTPAPTDDKSADTSSTSTSTDSAAAAPAPIEAPGGSDSSSDSKPVHAVSYSSPLLKIKDSPYTQKGTLLNRVYIARQHDTWKGVSQKIYSADRSKELRSWNPGIGSRAMKVGDKVYYSSPRDPSDNTRMLTYYEEQGIPPQSYVSKDGDNLKKVGSDLLGDKNSWKELWVTNRDLASKGNLPAGVEIKYWGDVAASPTPAQIPTPPSQTVAGADSGMVPPPTPPDANMDPTQGGAAKPADPTQQAAQPPAAAPVVEPPPPPPPPPAAPPVAPVAKKPRAEAAEPNTQDPDMMMWIGGGGIMLLAAAGIFMVIRKNRAKRIDLGQTQV